MTAENRFSSADDAIREARRTYPGFFMVASPEEESLIGAVILARMAFLTASAAPRSGVAAPIRGALERVTNGSETLFLTLRDAMRSCPAYSRMDDGERDKLERDVLETGFPGFR